MKTVRLIAFRGVGFSNPRYTNEDALIKAGHVGFQLEGDPTIYGFHPTEEAIEEVGGLKAALTWLKAHQTLEGGLFDDTAIFERARALSQDNPHLTVYEIDYRYDEDKFDIIKTEVKSWISEERTSPYRWPEWEIKPMPEEVDNCATFPRRLEIDIPETTGQVSLYIEAMREVFNAQIWKGLS